MNQNVKEAIEISMRDKRELDLKESISKLEGLPSLSSNDDRETFLSMIGSMIHDLRMEFLNTFNNDVPIKGLTEVPKNSLSSLFEIWRIQNDIDREFKERFDSEVQKIWIHKFQ